MASMCRVVARLLVILGFAKAAVESVCSSGSCRQGQRVAGTQVVGHQMLQKGQPRIHIPQSLDDAACEREYCASACFSHNAPGDCTYRCGGCAEVRGQQLIELEAEPGMGNDEVKFQRMALPHMSLPLWVQTVALSLVMFLVLAVCIYILMGPSKDRLSQRGGVSLFGTAFNVFSVFFSVGILQLPYAFYLWGWAAIGVIAFVNWAMCFSAILLIECLVSLDVDSDLPDQRTRDYSLMGRIAFGLGGERAISAFVALEMILIAALALSMIGTSTAAQLTQPSVSQWVAIVVAALVGLMLTLVPANSLTFISCVGNCVLFVCPALLALTGMAMSERPEPTDRKLIGNVHDLVTVLRFSAICYAGVPAIPHIYDICGPKREFRSALIVGMFYSGVCQILLGAMGYHFFGSHTAESFILNVGSELDGSKVPGALASCGALANLAIAFKLLTVFPFFVAPVGSMLDHYAGTLSHAAIRFLTVAFIAVLGICIRTHLVELIAFAGCTMTMISNVIIPAIAYVRLGRPYADKERFPFVMLLLSFGTLVGIAALVL